ncbi:MAG: hypothetical protein M1816_000041 [Peltula sp. TS41687]|nr:MAG: hypothetical protein M1816_000041 [Peltula sp. TS41687]
MFLQRLELTTALRPVLLPDESLLFVQNAVGLYEGKFKIPNFQNGQAYLTSHRVCYVDHERPRESSAAVDLKEVERYEFHAGFLRSSPKVVFFPKSQRGSSSYLASSPALLPSSPRDVQYGRVSPQPGTPSAKDATWICPICSFSNPVPSNFDPSSSNANTPLPPCLACGVTPPLAHVLKAAIAQTSSRESYGSSQVAQLPPGDLAHDDILDSAEGSKRDERFTLPESALPCPRCTFLNHPSLFTCEICGARLPSSKMRNGNIGNLEDFRSDSPGPSLTHAAFSTEIPESIKLSFRAGGDKTFYERLKGAMIQRKWLLQGAPPVPKPDQGSTGLPGSATRGGPNAIRGNLESKLDRTRSIGLAGLEQRDLRTRKNNEIVIGNAFEDLEALMASAKEIVALAETFAGTVNATGTSSEAKDLISHSATALGLATTKDLLGSGSNSESLYISELSRTLAEFLTDDATGVLRREGGIMSLVDLWAVFNRARGGVELVSPLDFHKAASMWETLNLSIRLRRFKSGLLVVQSKDRSDEKTVSSLLKWLKELRDLPPPDHAQWDYGMFGRGVTPQETAERFGWSVGVASEELQMAEDRGALCRDEGVEGLRFWENWFTKDPGLLTVETGHVSNS